MNENLRQALLRSHLREQDVAASLGVDPKTVRRWIEGRVPYPANRAALADLLHSNEADLWPESSDPLSARSRPDELVAVYPHRWAVPRETWMHFFRSAKREIGILAYSALFLAEDTGLNRVLTHQARNGVRVRIALGDPDSPYVFERGREEGIGHAVAAKARNALVLYRTLSALENVEVRLHRTQLYNSIYLSDEQALINQHVYGVPAADAPVLQINKIPASEMAGIYFKAFETIWFASRPAGLTPPMP
jgi:hypothetical protein